MRVFVRAGTAVWLALLVTAVICTAAAAAQLPVATPENSHLVRAAAAAARAEVVARFGEKHAWPARPHARTLRPLTPNGSGVQDTRERIFTGDWAVRTSGVLCSSIDEHTGGAARAIHTALAELRLRVLSPLGNGNGDSNGAATDDDDTYPIHPIVVDDGTCWFRVRPLEWYDDAAPHDAADAVAAVERRFDAHIANTLNAHVYEYTRLYARMLNKRADEYNDPSWNEQYHLFNQKSGRTGEDINVQAAWAQGVTGAGVVVAIIDTGIDYTHDDISTFFNLSLSYDFNFNDADPYPDLGGQQDDHGIQCGGVCCATRGNAKCGSGVAFEATVASLRLLDGATDDSTDASSLSYKPQDIDISSNSWGPTDEGKYSGGIAGTLSKAALKSGAETGRGGLGSVYTWAGGNGRLEHDNSNLDQLANSRYSISVCAVNSYGTQSWYSEPGANLHVCAPSNGVFNDIWAITLDNECSNNFGGTSSACPTVAGVVALMLDMQPELSYRDVQLILSLTARKNDDVPGAGWFQNAAGNWFNGRYGFGVVDADAAVTAASTWGVDTYFDYSHEYASGTVNVTLDIPQTVSYTRPDAITYISSPHDVAMGVLGAQVQSVMVTLNARHKYVGDIRFVLESPSGTQSVLTHMAGVTSDTYTLRLGSGTDFEYSVYPSTFNRWAESTHSGLAFASNETDLVLANPEDGCSTLVGDFADKIVLVRNSTLCTMTERIANVEASGAYAAVAGSWYGYVWGERLDEFSDMIVVGIEMGDFDAVALAVDTFGGAYSGSHLWRRYTKSQQGDMVDAEFASNTFLGEDPDGTWTLYAADVSDELETKDGNGVLDDWSLEVFGFVEKSVCATSIGDSDDDGVCDDVDECDDDPLKSIAGVCGCGASEDGAGDSDSDGTADCFDACPFDPLKDSSAGVCGCGLVDATDDTDSDGLMDCIDPCPLDNPDDSDSDGVCTSDDVCEGYDDMEDMDSDGTPDDCDLCPSDPDKATLGSCGCGVEDSVDNLADDDSDGTINCMDPCIGDADKVLPGLCGCFIAEDAGDDDNDGTLNCHEFGEGDEGSSASYVPIVAGAAALVAAAGCMWLGLIFFFRQREQKQQGVDGADTELVEDQMQRLCEALLAMDGIAGAKAGWHLKAQKGGRVVMSATYGQAKAEEISFAAMNALTEDGWHVRVALVDSRSEPGKHRVKVEERPPKPEADSDSDDSGGGGGDKQEDSAAGVAEVAERNE